LTENSCRFLHLRGRDKSENKRFTELESYIEHFSQENLDWAELVTIDLSKYDTPEGKQELAQSLIKALREKGFFYVKNFNISQEAVNSQFAIGRELYELPVEEKLKFVPQGLGACFLRSLRHKADIGLSDLGQFNGYVPAGRRMYIRTIYPHVTDSPVSSVLT
jgi:DNA-directed RNA polymerase specialized sigma54-like protein